MKIKAVNNYEAFLNVSIALQTLNIYHISRMQGKHMLYVLLLLHWHLSAST